MPAKKLTKADVRALSGPADDTSRSLDVGRVWLEDTCTECQAANRIAAPDPELNLEGYIADDVIATLPDGREIPVSGVPQVRQRSTLAYACNACGARQEADLP